jgi:hypothetical protein
MSLLGPLWAWLFITLPLAMLTAGLWLGVRNLPEPLPLDEYERRLARQHPTIHRRQQVEDFLGVQSLTAASYATTATSSVWLGPR